MVLLQADLFWQFSGREHFSMIFFSFLTVETTYPEVESCLGHFVYLSRDDLWVLCQFWWGRIQHSLWCMDGGLLLAQTWWGSILWCCYLATSCRQLLSVPGVEIVRMSWTRFQVLTVFFNISFLLDSRIFKSQQLRILDGRYLYSRLWFITKTERSWIQTSQGLQDRCSHHCCCMHGHSCHCCAHLHDEVLNPWTQHYMWLMTSTVFFFWISEAHFSVARVCWNREKKKIPDVFLQSLKVIFQRVYTRERNLPSC